VPDLQRNETSLLSCEHLPRISPHSQASELGPWTLLEHSPPFYETTFCKAQDSCVRIRAYGQAGFTPGHLSPPKTIPCNEGHLVLDKQGKGCPPGKGNTPSKAHSQTSRENSKNGIPVLSRLYGCPPPPQNPRGFTLKIVTVSYAHGPTVLKTT